MLRTSFLLLAMMYCSSILLSENVDADQKCKEVTEDVCEEVITNVCSVVKKHVHGIEYVEVCRVEKHSVVSWGSGVPLKQHCEKDTKKCVTEFEEVTRKECKNVLDVECKVVPQTQCHVLQKTEIEEIFDRSCETEFKDQCHTVYEEQCETVYTDKCTSKFETVCETSGYHCKEIPTEVCDQVPSDTCRDVPRQVCTKVRVDLCFPRNQNKVVEEKVCNEVEEEVCNPVYKEHCEDVHDQVPREVCKWTREVCSEGDEVCGEKEGESLSRRVCFQDPTEVITVVEDESCEDVTTSLCEPRVVTQCQDSDQEDPVSVVVLDEDQEDTLLGIDHEDLTLGDYVDDLTLDQSEGFPRGEKICTCMVETIPCNMCEVDCLSDCNDLFLDNKGKCFSELACQTTLLAEVDPYY